MKSTAWIKRELENTKTHIDKIYKEMDEKGITYEDSRNYYKYPPKGYSIGTNYSEMLVMFGAKRSVLEDILKPEVKLENQKIKTINLKFKGIDDFHRPVWKVVDQNAYYGSTSTLIGGNDKEFSTVKKINEFFRNNEKLIEYFGSKFNCEPYGGRDANIKFNIID